jgi:hypothetical protein
MKRRIIVLLACTGVLSQVVAQKPIAPPVKVAFSATISQPRQILFTSDANLLRRFDKIDFNELNGFDATTGVFSAPVAGVYCFIFNISYTNYGCSGGPTTFNVTLVKNNEDQETFRLPVWYGSGSSSEGFTALVQLNKGDRLELKSLAVFCTQSGSNRPSVNKVIFSGYKIN